MFFKKKELDRFHSKVWLASPTMHGEELQYMKEAYVAPSAQIRKGSIVEPMAVVHSGCVICVGCIVSAGAVVNHFTMLCDGAHIDCNATVSGNTLVPAGMKVKAGEVYRNESMRVEDLFFNGDAWAESLSRIGGKN